MAFPSDIRIEDEAERNLAKRESRDQAQKVLEAKKALEKEGNALEMASLTNQGGAVGRRIERELQRFESTGRVSNWLAGEVLKDEAKKEVPSSVEDFSSINPFTSLSPIYSVPKAEAFGGQQKFIPQVPVSGGGGGVATCIGLALYTKVVGGVNQVWIGAGTVAGQVPSGFDEIEGAAIASGGSGNVWAEININGTTGEIVSVAVAGGASTPSNTNTSFYYTLGFYQYVGTSPTVQNYGCGSLDAFVCRNWFVAEPPFFSVSFSR